MTDTTTKRRKRTRRDPIVNAVDRDTIIDSITAIRLGGETIWGIINQPRHVILPDAVYRRLSEGATRAAEAASILQHWQGTHDEEEPA